MPNNVDALSARKIFHSYGERLALNGLDLEVGAGEVFALLGPNGSGKTTLFRLIATLLRVQRGELDVFGLSALRQQPTVRSLLGVVFQSPSLDAKLSVLENMRCQAALYGIAGQALSDRIDEVAKQLNLVDRLKSKVEELSGGLKRRVEVAKGILHTPKLLLMDEPSTGLDPSARLDLWHTIKKLQRSSGVTVLLTTHLLEEAEKAGRIAIMDHGQLLAIGEPQTLRKELGERLLDVHTDESDAVLSWLESNGFDATSFDGHVRVSGANAAEVVAPLVDTFGEHIHNVSLGQPTLEDVFIAKTGHRFWTEDQTSE